MDQNFQQNYSETIMQSQQATNISWETMMRRRSSLSASERRLSLLSVDPIKDPFLGQDDFAFHDNVNIFVDSYNPTSIDPSYLAFDHAQARKNSLIGGFTGNPNLLGGLQNAGDLLSNSNSFHNSILGGLQSDGSLLTNNRYSNGDGMNNNFIGSMPVMQNNSLFESTRNNFLGTTSNSCVGNAQSGILGNFRNSLALGSITPLSERQILKECVGADGAHRTSSVSELGSMFLPFMLDQKSSMQYSDTILNKQMRSENVYSIHGAIHAGTVPTVVLREKIESGSTPCDLTSAESTVPSKTSRHIASLSMDEDDEEEDEDGLSRFKPFHEEKWTLRYKELLIFHSQHGHAAVPHTYPPNPQLARWVKRQRRQYKLCQEGKSSTMTAERLEMLSSVGFVWDSHDVNWREKFYCMTVFCKENGHCNVPSNYKDKKLATWVKCQRRQYKLYCDGKPSAMNPDRIQVLEKAGFEWEIRSTSRRQTSPSSGSSES